MDIYRDDTDTGGVITGKSMPAIICNGGVHFLTTIGIYQDGIIDCWGNISFAEFQEKVASGWIKTSVPEGKDIFMHPLGNMKGGTFHSKVKEGEFIKEVKDTIDDLNGRPTTSEICVELFHIYLKTQLDEDWQKLETAYLNVPEHNRKYMLGDMDLDDLPIKIALYGEEGVADNPKINFVREKVHNYLSEHTR